MNRPPSIEIEFEQLPVERIERHELLVDIFGRHFVWAMKEAALQTKILIESAEARNKLGRVVARPYIEAAATLNPEEQAIALRLIEPALQMFAKNILLVLQSRGISHKLGETHAIQYRLTEEIRDVENMELQLEEVINREGKKAFADYLAGWLNKNITK